ncbi:hypothetical protein O9993_04185 [Vibrio lentus]|nr:hypothetical protein [Vibrio lentus]
MLWNVNYFLTNDPKFDSDIGYEAPAPEAYSRNVSVSGFNLNETIQRHLQYKIQILEAVINENSYC